jgi:hypothetical protein
MKTTMKPLAALTTLALLLAAATGCGAKYPSDCKGAELAEPWKGMGLVTEEGRVCSSDGKKTEVLFPGDEKSKWVSAFESSLDRAGYAKDSCSAGYCVYKKDKKSPYVQMITGERKDGKRSFVRLSLIMQGS